MLVGCFDMAVFLCVGKVTVRIFFGGGWGKCGLYGGFGFFWDMHGVWSAYGMKQVSSGCMSRTTTFFFPATLASEGASMQGPPYQKLTYPTSPGNLDMRYFLKWIVLLHIFEIERISVPPHGIPKKFGNPCLQKPEPCPLSSCSIC